MSNQEVDPDDVGVLEGLDGAATTTSYWYLALLACIGGFLFGYDTAVIGSVLDFIPYELSDLATGYLVAGASLGAAVGALGAGPLTDRFGRKSLLMVDAGIFALGSILSAVTVNAEMLLLSRTLIGLAVGADSAIATAYIAEFAPSKKRGQLSIIQQWMITVGILVVLPDRPADLQADAGAGRRGRLEDHPRPGGRPGGDRGRAPGPDAGVPEVVDVEGAVRRHQEGAGHARDRGHRGRGASYGGPDRRAGGQEGNLVHRDRRRGPRA